MTARKGFTLIEMLVVIGIIVVVAGASIGGYSRLTATAERTRARELVSNVATAFGALYQKEGSWPRRIVSAVESDNMLDEQAAIPLAKGGYMSLDYKSGEMHGYDRYGIVTPWAVNAIKNGGKQASKDMKVGSSGKTITDHTLRFAVDLDGDGFTELPEIRGNTLGKKVRAVVCVWCCSKDGSLRYRDIIKSWSDGQVVR